MMWGKVWTSAREIKGSGSLQDLLRNIRSNFNQLQAEYRAIPPSIRDKWRQKEEEQNTRPIDHGLNPSEDWISHGYTPEYLEYIGNQLLTPTTVEELYELDRNYRVHQALLSGAESEFRGARFSRVATSLAGGTSKLVPSASNKTKVPPVTEKIIIEQAWSEKKGYKPKPGGRTTTKEEYKRQDQEIRKAARDEAIEGEG